MCPDCINSQILTLNTGSSISQPRFYTKNICQTLDVWHYFMAMMVNTPERHLVQRQRPITTSTRSRLRKQPKSKCYSSIREPSQAFGSFLQILLLASLEIIVSTDIAHSLLSRAAGVSYEMHTSLLSLCMAASESYQTSSLSLLESIVWITSSSNSNP